MVAIDFHSVEGKTKETVSGSQWLCQLFGLIVVSDLKCKIHYGVNLY